MSFVPTSNINVGIFTRELAANFLNVIVTITDEFLYKQLSTARQVATQRRIDSHAVFQLGLKSVQFWKQNHKDVFQARVIAQNRQISDMYVFCLYAYIRELYEESLCKVEVQIQRPTLGTFLHTYMRTVCDSVPVSVGEYFRMSYMEKRLFVENMIRMAFYNIVVQQNSVKAIIPLDNTAASVAAPATPKTTRNVQVIQTPVRNIVTPPMSPYVSAWVDAPMSSPALSSKRSSIVISEAKDVEEKEEFLQILDPRKHRLSDSSVESRPASVSSVSSMPKPPASVSSIPKSPDSVSSMPALPASVSSMQKPSDSVTSLHASVSSMPKPPDSVTSMQKPPDSVTSMQKPPDSVTSMQKPPDSVTSMQKPPDSVSSMQKPPDSVSSMPKPPDSVTSLPASVSSMQKPPDSVSSTPASVPLVSSTPASGLSAASMPNRPSVAPSSSSANMLSSATIKTSDAGEKPIVDYKMLAAVPSSHGGSSDWSVPNTASSQSATPHVQKPEQKQSLSVLFEAAMGDHVQRPSAAAPSEHHVYSIASQYKYKPKPNPKLDVKKRKSHEETYDDLELPTSEMTFGEDVKDLLADNTMSITPQDSVSYVAGFD